MINDIARAARAGRARGGRGAADVRRVPDAHAGRAARRCRPTPHYDDVVAEVPRFPRARAPRPAKPPASRASASSSIPGFGFGKTLAHNLALLRALARARRAGLSGARRAVAQVDARRAHRPRRPASGWRRASPRRWRRWRAARAIVRVHDVRETVDALAGLARDRAVTDDSIATTIAGLNRRP